jgi:hypothetical protein
MLMQRCDTMWKACIRGPFSSAQTFRAGEQQPLAALAKVEIRHVDETLNGTAIIREPQPRASIVC